MTALTIVGAGGHGRDIATIAHQALRYVQVVMLDDDPAKELLPTACVATAEWYLLGFNAPAMRERFDQHERDIYLVHPSAAVAPDTQPTAGLVIAQQVVIGPEVTFGRHVHINYHASMTRTTLGDYTTVAPGATIGGDVTIGARCFIGLNASIGNLVVLGDDVTVGMGAVIPPRTTIPAGVTVVGNPARELVAP